MRESRRSGEGERTSQSTDTERSGLGRRGFLRGSAATLTVAGLGATTAAADRRLSSPAQGSVPSYANWVPADDRFLTEDGEITVSSMDLTAFLELITLDDEEQDDSSEELSPLQIEPAILLTFAAVFDISTLEELGIARPIFGQSIDVDDPSQIETDAPADRFTAINDTTIYEGSFDTDAIQSAVDASDLQESSTSGVYTGSTQLGPIAVTWTSEYFISSTSVDLATTVEATGMGNGTRRHEQNGDFAQLLAGAGHGEFAATRLLPSGQIEVSDSDAEFFGIDYSVFGNAAIQGYAQSNTFDFDVPRLDAISQFSHASESDVDTSAFDVVAADASERSVSQSGRFVTVEASYTDPEVVGSDSTTGDNSDDDSTDDSSDDSTDDTSDDSTDNTGDDSTDDSSTDDSTADDSESESSDGGDGSGGDDGGDDGESGDDSGPGFGLVSALTGLGGASYVLKHRLGGDDE